MKKTISLELAAVLVVIAMLVTFGGTYLYSEQKTKNMSAELEAIRQKYDKLETLESLVDELYVGEYDKTVMMDSAAAGLIDGVGDQWSSYYTAEEYKLILESLDSSYSGIGVEVADENGVYRITRVFKDSPAEKAGVKPFDVITSVNGVSYEEYSSFDALASDIRGESGTEVNVGFSREGSEEFVLTIVREKVYELTVEYEMIDGNIGYIIISTFHENTDKQFFDAVDALIAQGAEALIFDVRMNGGGYVNIMADMLDILLPEGKIISLRDKDERDIQVLRSDDECIDLPMAVLTNNYSISAAEFFAAALQEYGVAEVVGDSTSGKGYAQTIVELDDGSAVNISLYKYYTPNGNNLKDIGIVPDHQISLTDDEFYNFYYISNEEDRQLMKAVEVVKSQIR